MPSLSSEPDDRDLIDRARAGDGRAFERLIATRRRFALVVAARVTRCWADAEDVVQDAAVNAWRGMARFEGHRFGAWFRRVVRNAALSFVRHRDFLSVVDDEARVPCGRAGPLAALERARLGASLERAIGSLPEPQRRVLVLRDVEGLDVAECMAAEAIPLGTALSRIHRARRKVMDALREEEPA
jgi:RNA polymerase sigma-70 factor (ECF subfamily)